MKQTISVLVENYAGVLSKVAGLFTRRGYNIESLAVGVTEDPHISRMTIVVNGDEAVIEQVEKQLNKLIPGIKVRSRPEKECISRQRSLFKVSAVAARRPEIIQIAELMGAKVIDVTTTTLTLECTDTLERTETLEALLKPYGIREVVRTGVVAIDKGASIANSKRP